MSVVAADGRVSPPRRRPRRQRRAARPARAPPRSPTRPSRCRRARCSASPARSTCTVRIARGAVPADRPRRPRAVARARRSAATSASTPSGTRPTTRAPAGSSCARELDDGAPSLLRADAGDLDYHDDRRTTRATPSSSPAATCRPASSGSPTAASPTRSAARSPRWRRRAPRAAGPSPRATACCACAARAARRAEDAPSAPRSPASSHSMRTPPRHGHPHVRNGLAAIDALADAWPRLPELAGPRLARRSPRCAFASTTAAPAARCTARCRRASSTTPRRCSDRRSSGARRWLRRPRRRLAGIRRGARRRGRRARARGLAARG